MCLHLGRLRVVDHCAVDVADDTWLGVSWRGLYRGSRYNYAHNKARCYRCNSSNMTYIDTALSRCIGPIGSLYLS